MNVVNPKTMLQTSTLRNLSPLERDPHTQLSLTYYPQVPPNRKREEQPVTTDISRPSHTLVTSLHPTSSSDPQQVLLDRSSFLTFRHRLRCTSFVCDPGTLSWRFSKCVYRTACPQSGADTSLRIGPGNDVFLVSRNFFIILKKLRAKHSSVQRTFCPIMLPNIQGM